MQEIQTKYETMVEQNHPNILEALESIYGESEVRNWLLSQRDNQ